MAESSDGLVRYSERAQLTASHLDHRALIDEGEFLEFSLFLGIV
jgi:hypothetical protein